MRPVGTGLFHSARRPPGPLTYVAGVGIPFLFKAEACVAPTVCTHSFTDGYLRYLLLLATVSNAAVNTHVRGALQVPAFSSLGFYPQVDL